VVGSSCTIRTGLEATHSESELGKAFGIDGPHLSWSIHGLLLVLQSKMEIVSHIMGMYSGIKCLPYRSIIVINLLRYNSKTKLAFLRRWARALRSLSHHWNMGDRSCMSTYSELETCNAWLRTIPVAPKSVHLQHKVFQ
jgi:hypothetical protein